MTKAKTTKRALLMSVLSMLLCVSMLVGSTFAWFTDTVTSGTNRIVAGNLDVELKYQNEYMTEFEEVKTTTKDLFVTKEGKDILWEPGAAAVTYLELKNAGTLALKYELSAIVKDTVVGNDGAALSKVLKTAVVEIEKDEVGTYTRETAIAAAEANDAKSVIGYVKSGDMKQKDETLYLAMIVYFPWEIGNEYNGAVYNRSDVELKTELALNLVAKQLASEEDSFDHKYDEPAPMPRLSTASALIEGAVTEDVSLSCSGAIQSAALSATAANGLYDEMKDAEADANELTVSLNVTYNGNTDDGNKDAMNLDISLTAVMVSTKNGEKVTTTKNIADLKDYFTISYQLPAGKYNVVVKHSGKDMVALDSADDSDKTDNGNGFYYYDFDTGMLTIKSKSFSPFTVSYNKEAVDTNGYSAYEIRRGSDGKITSFYEPNNISYNVKAGTNELTPYNTNKATGDVVIPSNITIADGTVYTVTSIGNSAFRFSNITSVTIPDTVTEISDSAFEYSYSLTSVTIPDSVTTIGKSAFYFCTSLTSVTIPDSVITIGESAFSRCTSLESFTLGKGVTSIGRDVFFEVSSDTLKNIDYAGDIAGWCKINDLGYILYKRTLYINGEKLTGTLVIPDGVTSIGAGAFRNQDITDIVIPASVASIGESAFDDTPWYNSQENGPIYAGKVLLQYNGTDTSFEIKEGTTGIAGSAFEGCESLTSVTIPDSVTSIGESAFDGCTALTSIHIPQGVTTIRKSAFWGTAITEVAIPSSVKTIEDHAFSNCKSLTSVTIPNSVTTIGNAFGRCTALESITIPDSVTTIGGEAFQGCSSLKSLVIPRNAKMAGGMSFQGCTALESIAMSANFIPYQSATFMNCNALKAVYLYKENLDSELDSDGEIDGWDRLGSSYNSGYNKAAKYLYSETQPEATTKPTVTVYKWKGSSSPVYKVVEYWYWHMVDGVPTPWELP